MKIIELNEFFGPAYPTSKIYIDATNIRHVTPHSRNGSNTSIHLKGSYTDNTLVVVEEIDYVLKKWKEALKA
jgi:hypothetical protein